MNRRLFLKNASLATAGMLYSSNLFAQAKQMRDFEKNPMNLAFVGTGLMGGQNMRIFLNTMKQNCVAVCDVDSDYGLRNPKNLAPNAPVFKDYREMFAKMADKIDGVIISTPDNSHFGVAMCALKYKLPIFVEKPLCYSIAQARMLTEAAKEANVVTQMGNFVHSGAGIDYVKEWINAGAIGKVKEVVAWTCRPLKMCNQKPKGWKTWPKPDKIPQSLDWDKWLNVTEYSDYYDAVAPLNWRRFYKFGSGSLGDIGCHILDIPITALNLTMPEKVESIQRGGTKICVPLQDKTTYYFPTSSQNVPVKVTWYSGFVQPDENGNFPEAYDKSLLPPLPKAFTDINGTYKRLSDDGMFIIGTEGVIYSPTMHLLGKPVLLPKARALDMKPLLDERTQHIKAGNHHLDFLQGIAGEVKKCRSDFSVAGPLTEIIQLGNLSLQLERPITWDSKNLKCVGDSAADVLINPSMRSGWY